MAVQATDIIQSYVRLALQESDVQLLFEDKDLSKNFRTDEWKICYLRINYIYLANFSVAVQVI